MRAKAWFACRLQAQGCPAPMRHDIRVPSGQQPGERLWTQTWVPRGGAWGVSDPFGAKGPHLFASGLPELLRGEGQFAVYLARLWSCGETGTLPSQGRPRSWLLPLRRGADAAPSSGISCRKVCCSPLSGQEAPPRQQGRGHPGPARASGLGRRALAISTLRPWPFIPSQSHPVLGERQQGGA